MSGRHAGLKNGARVKLSASTAGPHERKVSTQAGPSVRAALA